MANTASSGSGTSRLPKIKAPPAKPLPARATMGQKPLATTMPSDKLPPIYMPHSQLPSIFLDRNPGKPNVPTGTGGGGYVPAPLPTVFKKGVRLDASQVIDMRSSTAKAAKMLVAARSREAAGRIARDAAWVKRERAARAHGQKVKGYKPSDDIRRGS